MGSASAKKLLYLSQVCGPEIELPDIVFSAEGPSEFYQISKPQVSHYNENSVFQFTNVKTQAGNKKLFTASEYTVVYRQCVFI